MWFWLMAAQLMDRSKLIFSGRMDVERSLPRRGRASLALSFEWPTPGPSMEGYQGIIAVDGNGKDGVEAIDAFVEKLQAGFDYVQGSRYIAGGRAINTPIDRKIGGRFIHAPLL